MNKLEQTTFYVLDKQTAEAIDRVRDEAAKYFAAMVSGGNVYLLDTTVFESSEDEDIDLGETVKGCSYTLDLALTSEQKQSLLAGLIQQGYAVAPYPDRFLVIPWFRDTISDALTRDLRRLLPRSNGSTAMAEAAPADPLAARFFVWKAEHLMYSSAFDARDPEGDEQTDTESLIAAHLFDRYEDDSLFLRTTWIIAFVAERFFREILSLPLEDTLMLVTDLQEYLSTWQNGLASPNKGPDEEEAAQAGRNTLLLTLRYLWPEWVCINHESGEEG